MNHDERIEAMHAAWLLCPDGYRAAMEAAWAAADVESLVREAVEDAVEMFVAWAVNQSTPLGQPIDPPGIDAIVARVMQGAE